jgi:hypothetical protein
MGNNKEIFNEISDETLNNAIRALNYSSKKLLAFIRIYFRENNIRYSYNDLKKSISSPDELALGKDTFIQSLFTNSVFSQTDIQGFMNDIGRLFYSLNADAENVLDNKAEKREYFETLYSLIKTYLIRCGYSLESNETVQNFIKQILELIHLNQTPVNVLDTTKIATIHFLQEMLSVLANVNYISKEFKNAETQTRWIRRAFHFDYYVELDLNYFQLKIDWNNLYNLADWLLFLKTKCIVYKHKDNKQLLDWVIAHVTYKQKEFSKGSKHYESLIRSIKYRKDFVNVYFTLDENGSFTLKNYPSPN